MVEAFVQPLRRKHKIGNEIVKLWTLKSVKLSKVLIETRIKSRNSPIFYSNFSDFWIFHHPCTINTSFQFFVTFEEAIEWPLSFRHQSRRQTERSWRIISWWIRRTGSTHSYPPTPPTLPDHRRSSDDPHRLDHLDTDNTRSNKEGKYLRQNYFGLKCAKLFDSTFYFYL